MQSITPTLNEMYARAKTRAFKNSGVVSVSVSEAKCNAASIEQFNRISKSASLATDVIVENLQMDPTAGSPACLETVCHFLGLTKH